MSKSIISIIGCGDIMLGTKLSIKCKFTSTTRKIIITS